MAIDLSYIIGNTIQSIILSVVFIICLLIYTNTKDASLAYKKWAIGTSLMLIGPITSLMFGLLFECNETSTRAINEFHQILSSAMLAFGYFYLPVGVMYFSKDMDIGNVNEHVIRRSQYIFFSSVLAISCIFGVMIPFFSIIKIIGVVFNILYAFVWIFTIYYYRSVYSVVKSMNSCWSYLYVAVFVSLCNNVLTTLSLILWPFLYPITLGLLSIMAFGFITGFFK